ncbi:uncharacterized protein LOC142162250 [Nicotiana tabacum]|uniref:Uncharacterized protein LOC142162250 n=1 Tax=Nicotiana tabacum TaxID=4097 RepID=A0AC58RPQ4_TOBAC
MAKVLKENLDKAQNRMKVNADKKRTEREFNVGDWIRAVAYKLNLPPASMIHPVFHISQLKKRIGQQFIPSIDPPICSSDGQPLIEPIAVLDRRMVKNGNKASTQILVQWVNLLPEEATWEDYNFIVSQFPDFEML